MGQKRYWANPRASIIRFAPVFGAIKPPFVAKAFNGCTRRRNRKGITLS